MCMMALFFLAFLLPPPFLKLLLHRSHFALNVPISMYHHDTDSPLFFFSEFSFSFWSVQQFYIDPHFSFPFKIFMQHPSLCSVRFMSITAFDFIDNFFQDTSLQLQCVSFDQLIAWTVKLPFSCSVIFGQLTFSQL